MQLKQIVPNANKEPTTSLKSILNTIVKASSNSNIQTANKHWDIFYKPANNRNYSNFSTGA